MPHLEEAAASFTDWTLNPATNRTNSSTAFTEVVVAVDELLTSHLRSIADGPLGRVNVARIIVAQLAHVHGMIPLDVMPLHVREDLAARGLVSLS